MGGKYTDWLEPEGLETLEGWSMAGWDFEMIAEGMQISTSTLREWRKKFPAISAALKRGRAQAIARVENSLFRRAIGYSYNEDTFIEKVNEETGEKEMILAKRVTKHVPPDTTAQIFLLTNRSPDEWKRNRAEVLTDDEDKGTGIIMLAEKTDGDAKDS